MVYPPPFGRSVNPMSIRGKGVNYTDCINICPPPGFSDLPTALSRTQALALKRPDRIEEWIQGLLPTPQVNTIIHLANFFHQHLI